MSSNTNNCSALSILQMALPLMASALSWTLMISFDRFMLAKFDIFVMNAVVSLGSLLFLFEWGITSITVTSEIFAGQYNGSKNYKLAPSASWQMLYLSFGSIAIFLFAAFYLGEFIIPKQYYEVAGDFYKCVMCFLVFSPATAAINGFFIGIKKPKIILINSVFANILNIILSCLLIFGFKDIISPMGALGAAIATSIAIIVQFLIVFIYFISNQIDREYNSRNCKFDFKFFIEILKIGIPNSISLITEMAGNYVIQIIIVFYMPLYVSNNNIGLNLFIFLTFLLNGMNKAACGLAANIIGAHKYAELNKLLRSSIYIQFIFAIPVAYFCIFHGDIIARIYSSDLDTINYTIKTLPWVALHFLFDGAGWIICGIITAGGDTKFVMYANTIVVWLFRVLPIFILLKLGISFPELGWLITAGSSILYFVLFLYRFKSNKWLKTKLA